MRSKILFLLSHQPNPRFIKQINFLSQKSEVGVVYFNRDYMKDLSNEYMQHCFININIGNISNGNYVKRIVIYFKMIKRLYGVLLYNKSDILIVNNIDILIIFKICTCFSKTNTKIILEISDLLGYNYKDNFKSKIIRFIERYAFRYVDKLIVTSPKFYDMYYKKIFKKDYFVLENKPLLNMIPSKVEKINNKKRIIGIVGLLLQGKPYKALFDTVKDDERFEVHIYGKGIYEYLIKEYSKIYKNIKYFGEYNFFKDSAKIYSSIDILYMSYDTTSWDSFNNKIALPNKFYEAMYFGVPIITSRETYLGELVEKYKIGRTIKCCDNSEILNALISIDLNQISKNFDRISKDVYLGDNDYIRLAEFIQE
ncbi:glycosyltransferase [Campylobacter hyointestinalis]|uniref:glycosyltransferase n=1 Tax=Campylobacter hyointestinalis TaxID=198 RepID=UPI0025556791|nr:glycosyltransferase [Campylobacter hyointestinalis]MDL2346076.1 glycosyltransferase [Campylobacter hyointestinalis]MDL2347816.1 glycosyltransferase [Campylobacter hyointestinalis]MDL2349558.1 glycosyltransferase [Campylobacter hyointestinalis]MDM1025767.1 glycosyltransferase [Campylobacter hyointestinalis]MDM1028424.1 glycosyltransferase [Campylobacter hyointestinalis]